MKNIVQTLSSVPYLLLGGCLLIMLINFMFLPTNLITLFLSVFTGSIMGMTIVKMIENSRRPCEFFYCSVFKSLNKE